MSVGNGAAAKPIMGLEKTQEVAARSRCLHEAGGAKLERELSEPKRRGPNGSWTFTRLLGK